MKMCQDIIDFAELLIKYEHSSKLITINFGKLIKRTDVKIPKGFDEEIFNNDLFFKLERMEVIDLGSVISMIIDLFEFYNKSETVNQESEDVNQDNTVNQESEDVNQDDTVNNKSLELFDIPVPSFDYICEKAKIKLNNKTNLVPVKPLLANKIKNFKKKGNESIIPCTEPYDDSCTEFVEYNGEKYYYNPALFKKVIGSKTHVLEKI